MNHDREIQSKFWYITCPGEVESRTDGYFHHITSSQLLRLYQIPSTLQNQVWTLDQFQQGLRMGGPLNLMSPTLRICGRPVLVLKPQVDGDYSWDKLVLSTALETL